MEVSSLPESSKHKGWARLLPKARGRRHGTAVSETLLDAPNSGFAAGIHGLRHVLRAAEPNSVAQMVLFLAVGQPGARSEVALNFALAAASNKSRVLLVDADFSGRELSRRVAGGSPAGLLDVADDRAKFESSLIAEPLTGMMVLQAGHQAPGNRDRLVNPENILRVLEHAHRSYTVVVNGPMDRTDPLGLALAATADRTVLVVTAGLTRVGDLFEFQRSTELSGIKVSGVVLVSNNG
jgi:Mrp family chromosome partitioning ATPase